MLVSDKKVGEHHERSCYLHDAVVTFVSEHHSIACDIESVLRIRRGGWTKWGSEKKTCCSFSRTRYEPTEMFKLEEKFQDETLEDFGETVRKVGVFWILLENVLSVLEAQDPKKSSTFHFFWKKSKKMVDFRIVPTTFFRGGGDKLKKSNFW